MIPDLADLQSVSKNKNKARIINPRYHEKIKPASQQVSICKQFLKQTYIHKIRQCHFEVRPRSREFAICEQAQNKARIINPRYHER